MPILKLVRTKADGTWGADHFPGFGTVLLPALDPDGIELTKEMSEAIRLDPKFVRIPASLGDRISSLYVTMLGAAKGRVVDSSKEVSVVLLRDVETMTKWRVLVPTQEVGGASVSADFEKPLCDIETGEEVTLWPPEGWAHAGSSHSHNTMGAFFSKTDDENELPVPGVHFVLGSFEKSDPKNENSGWRFHVAPSIVYQGRRYEHVFDAETGKPREMSWNDIVDFGADEKSREHENVAKYVTTVSYATKANEHYGKGWVDRDYTMGFGYGLDDDSNMIEAAWRDYYGRGRGKIGDTSGDMLSWRGWHPDSLTDLSKYPEWLKAFDKKRMISGHGHPPETRALQRGVPVLVFGAESRGPSVDLVTVTNGTTGFLWCLRQQCFGSPIVEEGLARVIYGKGVAEDRYFLSSGEGPSSEALKFHEVIPMFRGELNKWAKRQRRTDKVMEKLSLTLEDGGSEGEFVFVTRGVSSTDFTPAEIEQLVEAWASNLQQRTTLRLAFRKSIDKSDKRGGSRR